MKKNNTKYAVAALFCVMIYIYTYRWALGSLSDWKISDMLEHFQTAENIYLTNLWSKWLERPYFLWHITVKGLIKYYHLPNVEAGAVACALFAVLSYLVSFFIIDRMIQKYIKEENGVLAAGLAATSGFATYIYIWWLNEGHFSLNPFHNPTQMAVKPFSLLVFMCSVDILIKHYKDEDETIFFVSEKRQKLLYPLFSLFLLLSVLAKPTFLFMFLPAGFVFLLVHMAVDCIFKKGKDVILSQMLLFFKLLLASIPSLVYIAFEYFAFYVWGGTNDDARVAVAPFLTGWHTISLDVPTSMILAMAFPLFVLLMDLPFFLKSIEGSLAFVAFVIGTLEFSFLVETGFKLTHLNFAWEMESGMLLLWVVALGRLGYRTATDERSIRNVVTVLIGWIILMFHVISGIYYLNPGVFLI